MTQQQLQSEYSTITALDVDSLAAGVHRFWFQASTNAMGVNIQLPVIAIKAEKPGPKVMITAGVHGDELNGILTAHKLARTLENKVNAGVVTIVPSVNIPGILNHSRDFNSSDPDASPANLNRFFPGNEEGDAANRYLYRLWNHLLKPNADFAVDLHTQTRGSTYPLYVFADFRLDKALAMARLIEPDVILNDPGDAGVLETVWNSSGIPSITIEVGMGKITQPELIERTVTGVQQILINNEMLDGAVKVVEPCQLEGQSITTVRARQGGFVIPEVSLLQSVEEGELLAKQFDAFGMQIDSYHAPHAGTVLSYNVDSLRDPGALVVRLIR
ncbi:succinylglutamate desuccinylase/aspartoacylase family protein [Vibrio sp. SCSIO 43140]|uniref:succinylglutamate desuccinylase/aspartoacylase family protein n=1 Tax=Vibrio sp. SCSIO 43140 TaxID=2819100 RepID=UPI0020761665|nr:succinylglutamate desuccinylase/aspartoacylase family protein [Vibrio sp. SCSIO 43140]USD62712.1 succinylglutamate desuccinylase/aspartoacylase family protein [Vibrio sp. SCSIO 43140]